MNNKELFDLVLKEKLLTKIEYVVALFTIPYMENNTYNSNILKIENNTVIFKTSTGDYKLDYYMFPLLDYLDNTLLKKDDWKCLDNDIETSIGISIANFLILEDALDGKIPFVDGKITSSIEDVIAERLVSDNYVPKNEEDDRKKIRVRELIKYVDNCEYLKTWNRYFVQAASERTMLPPEGITEKKQAIIKEMIAELGPNAFKDQVNVVKLEERLKEIDREWLKDDPTLNIVTSGKVLNNSRKELFLTMGGIPAFDDEGELSFVLNSLLEGWPSDPDTLTAMFNSLRAGSRARALDTQYGGLFAKIILRAIGSYTVKLGVDCGTTIGKNITIDDTNFKSIKFRHIIDSSITKLIDSEEMAKTFIGKKIIVRSPETCALVGENYCQYCVSKLLSENPDGIKNEVTEVTSIVMNESMKKMHNTTKSITRLNKKEIFS